MSVGRPLPRLALIEWLDADGHVLRTQDVQAWPLSIGRALDNDVVLHDAQAAAHHATVDRGADGRLVLTAGPSRNGVRLYGASGDCTLASGEHSALPPLARWQVGREALRIRTLEDPLPDEEAAAAAAPAAARWVLPGLGLAVMGWIAASLWVDKTPAASWEDYAPILFSALAAFALWAGIWGLVSKLFTRHFSAQAHLRVVLSYTLVALAADLALALLAYMLDWPLASRIRNPLALLLGAAMLAQHLRLVAPKHPRRINAGVAVLALLGVGITTALQWQRTDRLFEELYAGSLPPPAWRLVRAQPVQTLTDELRTLEAPLLDSARKAALKEAE